MADRPPSAADRPDSRDLPGLEPGSAAALQPGSSTPFSIIVNGAPRTLTTGRDVPALLDELGLQVGSVVVELNGVALTPSESARAALADGDTIEIVRAVAGG